MCEDSLGAWAWGCALFLPDHDLLPVIDARYLSRLCLPSPSSSFIWAHALPANQRQHTDYMQRLQDQLGH